MGLFLGISFLSVVEVVYYSTLHLFWIIYRPELKESGEKSKREDVKVDYIDQIPFMIQNRAVCFNVGHENNLSFIQ